MGRRRERIQLEDGILVTNRYVYDGWLVVAVLDGDNEVLEQYVYGVDLSGTRVGAGGIGGILQAVGDEVAYYHYDGNGNVISATDSNAVVMTRLEYDPFGRVLVADGSYTPRYQFSSKEYDTATGLNYYGYRFYSPQIGKWLSRDPIQESGGINLYQFVRNQPVNLFDAYGLFSWSFTSADLGQRAPVPILGHPGYYTRGQTEHRWSVSAKTVSCGDGKEKVDVTGDAHADFWWYELSDRDHELHHVDLYRTAWQELKNNVLNYTECMCPSKARCYKTLVDLLSQAHLTRARERNKGFDCQSYGNLTGACDQERALAQQFQSEWQAVEDQYQKCAKE